MWIVKPGDSFNDIPVLERGSTLANAITLEETMVYGMCKSHMRFLIEKYPTIALNTLKVFENKMNYLISLIDDLCFQPVTHRVIKLLLEYAGKEANNTNPMPHLTQQQMAARVGTVREMVNRCLKALEAEGSISMRRHQIIILDKERLEKKL